MISVFDIVIWLPNSDLVTKGCSKIGSFDSLDMSQTFRLNLLAFFFSLYFNNISWHAFFPYPLQLVLHFRCFSFCLCPSFVMALCPTSNYDATNSLRFSNSQQNSFFRSSMSYRGQYPVGNAGYGNAHLYRWSTRTTSCGGTGGVEQQLVSTLPVINTNGSSNAMMIIRRENATTDMQQEQPETPPLEERNEDIENKFEQATFQAVVTD